jgi:hypothetical protein
MGVKVRIQSLEEQGETGKGLVVKCVGTKGETEAYTLEGLGMVEVDVIPGAGVVLEAVDLTPPDPNAIILGDDLSVLDGGG